MTIRNVVDFVFPRRQRLLAQAIQFGEVVEFDSHSALESFDQVELDVTDVTDVGQGFADELLRVWASLHPNTTLIPINTSDTVAFMTDHALRT